MHISRENPNLVEIGRKYRIVRDRVPFEKLQLYFLLADHAAILRDAAVLCHPRTSTD